MHLQQSVQANLLRKYDKDFNFYCAKPVNQIVFNETVLCETIQYKDVAIFAESNEYLKRIYRMKNSANRNEIYERINMLSDFYGNSVLLRYQHPIMIKSNTKDIFIKRLRRMKKMIASDCSSDQSSEKKSCESSAEMSFESSGFLHSIKTKDLSSCKDSRNSHLRIDQDQSEKSVYNIYDQNQTNIHRKISIHRTQSIETFIQQNLFKNSQEQLAHLIIDIDDVDKQEAEQKYKKVKEKQNRKKSKSGSREANMKKNIAKKSAIIITSLDCEPNSEHSEESLSRNGKFNPRKSCMLSKMAKRDVMDSKEEYDETIKVGDRQHHKVGKHFNSPPHLSSLFSHRQEKEKETERKYITVHDQYEASKYPSHRYRNPGPRSRIVTHENSPYQLEAYKRKKKVEIRERAIALLHGVRSQEHENKISRYRNI